MKVSPWATFLARQQQSPVSTYHVHFIQSGFGVRVFNPTSIGHVRYGESRYRRPVKVNIDSRCPPSGGLETEIESIPLSELRLSQESDRESIAYIHSENLQPEVTLPAIVAELATGTAQVLRHANSPVLSSTSDDDTDLGIPGMRDESFLERHGHEQPRAAEANHGLVDRSVRAYIENFGPSV